MEKRFTSFLIPYCLKQNDLYVFLQRRSPDAPRNPNDLGAFGGGFEGHEDHEEALIRELQEELEYTPTNYEKLSTFETANSVSMAYIEKVQEGFEKMVKVHEGERGEWHKAIEVVERDDISQKTQQAVKAMIEKLT